MSSYPAKLQPKVSEEAFRMPRPSTNRRGHQVEKFNVYKEKDEQRPDFRQV